MWRKPAFSVLIVSLLGLVDGAVAGVTIMQCDVGGCGPLQAGWTSLDSCGTYTNVGSTGIDVTLATGNPGACACRNPGGSGALADVEWDLLFADDEISTPGGDFIITFGNLTAGASYRLLSFHNRSDEGLSHIEGVVVTGATNVTAPDRIAQDHPIMDDPAEILFVAGAGNVSIRYIAPTEAEAGRGAQAFLNGFILEITGPVIQFESTSSGALESVSPAVLTVIVNNAEAGQTYTVDYAATGGTATNGVDYILAAGTLTFNPGVTSQPIEITIINDGEDENDETIIIELSNPTGGDVTLGGITQHTYVILDPRPGVGFDTAASSDLEDVTPATIAVSLSAGVGETVTVNYAVTGGTATGGGLDYTLLGSGTLTFVPWDTTETISMNIVDDVFEEIPDETVELTLSNPSSNVKLAIQHQHTYTIIDNEAGVAWDGLTWYYSEDPPTALFVNEYGQLEWSPEKGGQFITRLPEHRLSQAGDIVELTYWWMTDGATDCDDCFRCEDDCYADSIECIDGTSDFRAGFFQADGQYITGDGFDVSSSIFEGYKGYAFRFGPNMKAGPVRWDDCGEVMKTGNFQKKPVDLDNLMTTNDGLEDYIPGFELPPGEWSLWTISLERLSSSSVRTLITLNDRTYTWTDTDDDDQPSKIDVFAIHMRNGRPYSILALDTLAPPPEPAYNPSPADGAGGVDPNVVLSWSPGENAASHDVYLGTNFINVDNADTGSSEYKGSQILDANSYDPSGALEPGVTYYWRIDEVSGAEVHKGEVWSFMVGNYIILDDMESYNSTSEMFDAWKGWPYPDWDNGASANLEETIVHGGLKAMDFSYSNLWPYSTVTHIYSAGQDWAGPGFEVLVLWFRGESGNDSNDQPYVMLKDGSGGSATVPYDGDADDVTKEQWQLWKIELQEFDDGGVDLTDVEEVVIGSAGILYGHLYFDDIGLYIRTCVPEAGPAGDFTGDCFVDFRDLAILGNQWMQPPGTPSADIAPEPPDGFVDELDLASLVDSWLEQQLFP